MSLETELKQKAVERRERLFPVRIPPTVKPRVRDFLFVSSPQAKLDQEFTSRDWRSIVSETAAKHGVTVLQILSNSRQAKIVAARFETYARIYTETTMSPSDIGRKMNRDHSTVLYGLEKLGALK